jgi:hypothetical protein
MYVVFKAATQGNLREVRLGVLACIFARWYAVVYAAAHGHIACVRFFFKKQLLPHPIVIIKVQMHKHDLRHTRMAQYCLGHVKSATPTALFTATKHNMLSSVRFMTQKDGLVLWTDVNDVQCLHAFYWFYRPACMQALRLNHLGIVRYFLNVKTVAAGGEITAALQYAAMRCNVDGNIVCNCVAQKWVLNSMHSGSNLE